MLGRVVEKAPPQGPQALQAWRSALVSTRSLDFVGGRKKRANGHRTRRVFYADVGAQRRCTTSVHNVGAASAGVIAVTNCKGLDTLWC